VLERLKLRATVYVATAFIGATSRWLADIGEGDRPVLSADDMRAVPSSVAEFGAHSHTHAPLDVTDSATVRHEMAESKRLLEEALARPVTTFAYPFGYERTTTRRLVREAGYTSACRVGYRHSEPHEDLFALSRVPVYGNVNLERFEQLLGSDLALRGRRMAAAAWRPLRQALAPVTQRRAA
jgi:peptidoglycan/xylan/chitin deacetylase (PgdA/CDA1 family)